MTTLHYSELKKGAKIILDNEPYEILEAKPVKMAQRRAVIQTKIRNLITGNVFSRNFQQGENFEEAEISKIKAKFLYSHRDNYYFSYESDPSYRFNLKQNQIGPEARFLKTNQVVETFLFKNRAINIILPIKIDLKITEAPPGTKGGRAETGTKTITLETGAKINVPLFIEEGDIVEVNTETGEYVRRIEQE